MGLGGTSPSQLLALLHNAILIGNSSNLPVEVIPTGELTISDLGVTSFSKTQYKPKSSDETIVSDIVLGNVAGLNFDVEANSEYLVRLFLWITSHSTPDMVLSLSSLTGATGERLGGTHSGSTPTATADAFGSGFVIATSGSLQILCIVYRITTTTNAGTIHLQFRQAVSDVNNTTINKNSLLICRKLN